MNNVTTQQKGFALLLSLIVSSIVLAIGLSMLQITLKQLSLGTTTKGSEIAFQAANAGMECLRYTRNDPNNDFLSGNITLKCLVNPSPLSVDDENGGAGPIYRYNPANKITWNTAGGSACIDIDMYYIDASANSVTYTFPSGDEKTCALGDACTFGFVRGYNRGCNEIGSSIFTVQRELTVEF